MQCYVDAASSTSALTSSKNCNKNFKTVLGCGDYVAPVREQSLFWHNIWMDCGRPDSGHVADIMRRTRAAYHYTIRHVREIEGDVIKQRFATRMLNTHSRNFWHESQKLKSNRGDRVSSNVDGKSDANNIAQLFAEKYKDLYSSASYDKNKMLSLRQEIDDLFSSVGSLSQCVISCS